MKFVFEIKHIYIVFGLKRNHVALKEFYKIKTIKHQQNNDSVGVFNPIKPNQIEIPVWIWQYRIK